MEEENYDIYGDLDEALIEPLDEDKKRKQEAELLKIEDEKRTKEELEEIFSKLRGENSQLKKNMSLLLVTAKKEIERKDQQLKELRRELDNLIFRKTNVIKKKTSEKFTQTNIPQPTKFTQTIEAKLTNDHHFLSRDPVERLKLRRDRDLSRERRRSRDRNRESPKKTFDRHPRDRTNDRRDKSPLKRSPDRRRRHNYDTNKPRSRHESPEKSNKKRSSSREKDFRREAARSKSPRKESIKIEKVDLREKLFKRNNRVIITDIKNDGHKIIVESKTADEHEAVPLEDVNHAIKVECETKLENLNRDEHAETSKAIKRDGSEELKLNERKVIESKCDQKHNDKDSLRASKSKPDNIKVRKVVTPKKSPSRKRLEKRVIKVKSEKSNDIKAPELLKILGDELELDQKILPDQIQLEITKSPERLSIIDQEKNLPDTKNELIIQSSEEIKNSSNDVLSNELFIPDVSNEVELTSKFMETDIINENDNSEEIKTNAVECHSEVATIKENREETPKLYLVPIEIGPQYCYKNTTDVSSDILELPLSNEEVIFDSRNLSNQDTPIKSPENESFDSTKENSAANSSLNTSPSNKSKKRKIVTTEVEDDGTVVFTIIRKKKRKIAKN